MSVMRDMKKRPKRHTDVPTLDVKGIISLSLYGFALVMLIGALI